jgi:DNA/RNA-binding domain of Phe-tRNA-synthetase-like protein
MMFTVSPAWRKSYPGAAAGILAMQAGATPAAPPALDKQKAALEEQLRERYSGYDKAGLAALPVLQAYEAYYRGYKKTYHVALQLESLVLKGKPIPSVAALVEAMFMAELKNLLLTAGHDLQAVHPPIRLDVAHGDEHYQTLRGQDQQLKAGDMHMADTEGILSSVLYGPDFRTRIKPETRQVLFAVYAPAGIGEQAVREHLDGIRRSVHLIAPGAETLALEVHLAQG